MQTDYNNGNAANHPSAVMQTWPWSLTYLLTLSVCLSLWLSIQYSKRT